MRRSVLRSAPWVLLLLLFALLSFGSRQLTFTFDEPSHLTAGYAFLARGATWTMLQRGHPLLVDGWEALPIYLGDPHMPLERLEGWGQDYLRYVRAFAPLFKPTLERTEVAGRTPAMLLTVLLAAVVYRWARDMWGPGPALLALGAMLFDPTLLAHGRLATNDVGVTALGTLGLYLVWRWERTLAGMRANPDRSGEFRDPGRKSAWLAATGAGFVLGLTMLAKGSGLLWAGVGVAWAAWTGLRRRSVVPGAWAQGLALGAVSCVVVWGFYGFEVGAIPGGPPIPLPAPQHWAGVLFHSTTENTPWVIALGTLRRASWPWYFPLGFAIKNPVPLLLALLLAGVELVERRRWRPLLIPGTFSALYLVIAVTRGPNLGYRHMIPLHPLFYLIIAGGVGSLVSRKRIWRWVLAGLGTWYVAGTALIYPHELAFFNQAVGGPSNGWRYMEGSNTDWGQAWKALETFKREQGVTFSYSGTEGYAGIVPYELWEKSLPPLRLVSEPIFEPWLFPKPGDYVISANSLTGFFLVNRDNFAWFRYHTPDAVIGHVLYYYHVEPALAPTWLAQCDNPSPLDEGAIATGFGEIELRILAFDCTQSWVYPGGGMARGVYALHGATLRPERLGERLCLIPARPADPFSARHLEGVPLGYRQWEYHQLPAFVLYEREGGPPPAPASRQGAVAPVGTVPATLGAGAFHTAPLELEGPLSYLGASATVQGDSLEVETWWRVTEGPVTRPFSIIAHLLAEDGTVLSTADGWGVSPLVLLPGDVVVQRHRFPEPAQKTLWLRTGGYWIEGPERWPVVDGPGDSGLFVLLAWE